MTIKSYGGDQNPQISWVYYKQNSYRLRTPKPWKNSQFVFFIHPNLTCQKAITSLYIVKLENLNNMNRKIKNRKIIHFNRKNKIFKLNKKITKNNIYFLKKAFPSVSLDWKEIIFEFKLLTVNGVQKLKKKKNIYP